ncbi:hypothetical protein KI387_010698, partial [Taxus chinensis]
ERSNLGAVLGAAIGGSALILITTLLLVVVYRKRSSSSKLHLMNSTSSKVEKFLQDYTHQMPPRYSYPELKKITNNFADKLGEG